MEFEVEKGAVESYKSYSIYDNWKIPEGIDGSKSRPYRSTTGFYLVNDKYPECSIVGDVLTSNKVWCDAKERKNNEISTLLQMFEKTYHSKGNYIPIPEIKNVRTAQLSGKNCDTYTHHLKVCKDAIEGRLDKYQYPAWKIWADMIWTPYWKEKNKNIPPKAKWEFFVEEFYFWDYVDELDLMPKSFVYGRDNSCQVGIRKKDEDETVKQTIINTIKLYIQREYRIENRIKNAFDFEKCNEFKDYRMDKLAYAIRDDENADCGQCLLEGINVVKDWFGITE